MENDDLGPLEHLGFRPEAVVEPFSAENVAVDMRDRLAGIAFCVEDEACAALGETFLFCDILGAEEKPPHQRGIFLCHVEKAFDVLPGNDEDVRGRLRVQIAECVEFVVFVNFVRRDFAADDFTENAVGHGNSYGRMDARKFVSRCDFCKN